MKYKLVIFDLDGTLLDSIDGIGAAMNEVLKAHNFPRHDREAYYYFVDCHTEDSTEFSAYVPHCIAGTEEVELVPELIPQKGERSHVIRKNSTNGFMAKEFQEWLTTSGVTNFIITGLVTDICVMTFALTLKTYFNEQNIPSRLVVPLNAVETFDLDMTNHQADMMNLFALYNMGMNGMELVKGIRI